MEEQHQLTNRVLPATATAILPIEVWSGIFEKLKSTPETVISCREVCVDFKNEVDRKMIRWVKPPELDPLPTDETPVKKFVATKIYSRESMAEFQEFVKNHRGNPFPTRMLSFRRKNCSCTFVCCLCLSGLEKACFHFSPFSNRFGMNVHVLTFNVLNRTSLGYLKRNVFHNFPNLRQLQITMARIKDPWRSRLNNGPSQFDWLKEFSFPPLPHLTHLKLHLYMTDGKIMIGQILKAYGSQIKSLSVSNWEHVPIGNFVDGDSSDIMPNLTNLKIRHLPENGEKHVLNFLKNGNWLLKQLTVIELCNLATAGFYTFKEIRDVIAKFATTLEILRLDFADESVIMRELNDMSASMTPTFTPEDVANELQMNVNMPLVHELSLPFCCLTKGFLATRKFCENFVNLKTIHFCVYDYGLKDVDFSMPNYKEEINTKWWPVLSATSKLNRVVIFSGNQFEDNVVVNKIINKPVIH